MQRLFFFYALTFLFFIPFAKAQTENYDRRNLWQKEIDAFAEIDRRQTPPENAVLFVGSSSIRGWRTLREDFPNLKFINRGFGGSQIIDSVYFADKIILPYKPLKIVFYAGDNDIAAGKTPEMVLADFKSLVSVIQKSLPKTEILFVSIKPSIARLNIWDASKRANELIKNEIKTMRKVKFVDVAAPMLNAKGEPLPDTFLADKLHMNDKGYRIWRETLAPFLK